MRAKVQLNTAAKKGDQAKVTRLTQAVHNRETNIRVIRNEMGRWRIITMEKVLRPSENNISRWPLLSRRLNQAER